jgi:hypothetical protein
VTGADKPSGTGNSSAASRVQDANGFITQETDFLGVNTMYTWDINRRLPLSTTKAAGLPEAQSHGHPVAPHLQAARACDRSGEDHLLYL